MGFRNINIKIEYETLADDLVEEFYVPVLKEATLYKRAVGFFSSTVLLQITRGLSSLIERKGKMQLLISPKLDPKDYDAIEKGYEIKKQLEDKIIQSFDENVDFDQKEDRFGMLSYLISSGVLDIKIVALEKENDKAMYHEKLGILIDDNDDMVCFSGSLNDSNTALNLNYEAIDVYCAWKSDDSEERCIAKNMRFSRIWNGKEKGLITIDFPEVIKKKLLKYHKTDKDYIKLDEDFIRNYNLKKIQKKVHVPSLGDDIKLKKYQEMAINKWEENGYKGIFDMATGTGKTFTGCGAIVKLFENNKRLFTVICCPYIHLVDQWCDEVKKFNIEAIKCYGAVDYKLELERAARKFKHKRIQFVCVIVVNRTFQSEYFQKIIDININDTLLIVDEAHNFGSFKLRECLKETYPYRLALSATLDRYGDEEGTKILYDYFGEKSIIYTLEEAINKGNLTPYYYHPIIVNLTEDELDKYKELTTQIGKRVAAGKNDESLKRLLIQRARLIAGAHNKLIELERLMQTRTDDNNMLVYCGAVKYGEEGYDSASDEKKQIEMVVEMLNRRLGIQAVKFTSEEDSDERKEILNAFKDNVIQAIVAIKCLDEGMNIPAIKTAFILASSTNPKEYIQRRGRVLRTYPGKEFAEIYDFITLPFSKDEVDSQSFESINRCKGLVKREINRFVDFANLAINTSECNNILDSIKSDYKLDIIVEEETDIYE